MKWRNELNYRENALIYNASYRNGLIVTRLSMITFLILEWLKNKIFKQGIGIAEKSLETRRDCCGGNVNPKSLF